MTPLVLATAPPETLDPMAALWPHELALHELIFDPLFREGPDGFTSDIVADAAIDGGVVTVRLVPGIHWHDGAPLTVDDVCFTVERLLDPQRPTVAGARWGGRLAGCRVDGDAAVLTVRGARDPREALGFDVLPRHAYGAGKRPGFAGPPVGTGPYRVAWERRGQMELHAFPNPHHAPQIDRILLAGDDPFVQIRMFMHGGVDGLPIVPPAFLHEDIPNTHLALLNDRCWSYVAINTHHPPLDDVRVRRALDRILDRETLAVLTGATEAAPRAAGVTGPFTPDGPRSSPHVGPTSPDPAAAKGLLEQAGLQAIGGRWTRDGAPVRLHLGYADFVGLYATDLGPQIARQLGAAGFEVSTERLSGDQWMKDVRARRDNDRFDLLVGEWCLRPGEDVRSLFAERGLDNLFGDANPRIQARLAEIEAAPTDAEADAAARALHLVLAEELPYLFLWRTPEWGLWRDDVEIAPGAPWFYSDIDAWRKTAP